MGMDQLKNVVMKNIIVYWLLTINIQISLFYSVHIIAKKTFHDINTKCEWHSSTCLNTDLPTPPHKKYCQVWKIVSVRYLIVKWYFFYMICTNLCTLIDGIDIKPAFKVVFDLKLCTFFLNTGKMFSIVFNTYRHKWPNGYRFLKENYMANKTNCKVTSPKFVSQVWKPFLFKHSPNWLVDWN